MAAEPGARGAKRRVAQARALLLQATREYFSGQGYLEVETPLAVPGREVQNHLDDFVLRPELAPGRPGHLITSPELEMKRLLAAGFGDIFQITRFFRAGERTPLHNPEFTGLEFYRVGTGYHGIMAAVEAWLFHVFEAFLDVPTLAPGLRLLPNEEYALARGGREVRFARPFARLTMRDAILRATGVDLHGHTTAPELADALVLKGVPVQPGDAYDDLVFRLFLTHVEPQLGAAEPVFLTEWPAPMAALARLKPGDSRVAERVELFAGGLELGNGFSELTDAAEQRSRFVAEARAKSARTGEPVPLDEEFLDAVGHLPACAGIAVGLDRVLMLLTGAETIQDVLLFPL